MHFSTSSASFASLRLVRLRLAMEMSTFSLVGADDADDTSVSSELDTPLPDSRRPTASSTDTFINLIKGYLGAGLLGLPYGFKSSGLLAGLFTIAVLATVSTHCMLILVSCKQALRTRGAVSYTDVVHHTLGPRSARFAEIVLILMQYGFTVVYLVYVADNLHGIFDVDMFTGRVYVLLIVFPLFFALSLIPSLNHVSKASLAANGFIIIGVSVIIAASFEQIEHEYIPDIAFNVTLEPLWSTWPIMFGISMFALEGVGLVLPSETAMIYPSMLPKVLALCMMVASMIYCVFGVVPYMAFGQETGHVNGQITDNIADVISKSDKQSWNVLLLIVRYSLVFSLTLTYPVQLFVVTDIFDNWLISLRKPVIPYRMARIVYRLVLVGTGILLAMIVPKFGALVGLVGAFGGSLLQFTIPALCQMSLRWRLLDIPTRALLTFYAALGIIGAITGSVQSIRELAS